MSDKLGPKSVPGYKAKSSPEMESSGGRRYTVDSSELSPTGYNARSARTISRANSAFLKNRQVQNTDAALPTDLNQNFRVYYRNLLLCYT